MAEKMQEQASVLLKEAIEQLRQGCLLQGEEKYRQVAALAPELLANAEECCFRSQGGNELVLAPAQTGRKGVS